MKLFNGLITITITAAIKLNLNVLIPDDLFGLSDTLSKHNKKTDS